MLGKRPGYADPLHPTAAELRRAALFLPGSAGQGFGRLFGPDIDETTGEKLSGQGKIAGEEYLTYADEGEGKQNVAMLLQIPANLSSERRCLIALPAAEACARRVVLANRSSRAVRYSSSRRDSASSGASSGSRSITMRSTIRFGKPALYVSDVLLEAAHHHVLERPLAAHLDAAGEAVRVEQLEQRREAVRVAVVRRRGKEQTVLEAAGEIAHGARELGLDPVAPPARGRGVMGLVQDQKAARQERTEPLTQRIRVGRVDQEVVGDQEAAVRAPRIHAEAALAPHPRQIGAVEQLEHEAEPLVELGLPLLQDRRWRRDHDGLGLLAQEQLARDETGLDRLAETRVVGDEEVDARQAERLCAAAPSGRRRS